MFSANSFAFLSIPKIFIIDPGSLAVAVKVKQFDYKELDLCMKILKRSDSQVNKLQILIWNSAIIGTSSVVPTSVARWIMAILSVIDTPL